MTLSRRTVLTTGAASAAALTAVALDQRPSAAAAPPARDPFTLGVASGDPAPDGFVLWTRLATDPVAADGLGGMRPVVHRVQWQVAEDPRFRRVVRSGQAPARPEAAHAVHVELTGLRAGRDYWFRFRLGRWVSAVGRTRTTPHERSLPDSMLLAFASCSNLPAGHFTAYRRLAEDQPDLILHLGDYMYEGGGNGEGRNHAGPETTTLAGYRQRYGQYHADPDLQEAHAVAPWLVVWDDHEVDNNYADEIPEKVAETPGFRERRAAAYRAYYENMPLRRASVPRGPDLQLFRRVGWGRLATFHMLDSRQYRSDQACGDGYQDCPEADDPSRSLLGQSQERWLLDGFRRSRQRWDVLGQQVFFGRRDADPGAADSVSMDAWDGYAASRRRIARGWQDARVRNPIVLTGDVHAHWGAEVRADYEDGSPVVGSEFVTSSITSGGDGYDAPDGRHPWFPQNPDLTFWTNLRGYVRARITPEEWRTDYRCLPQVSVPGSQAFTRATFTVADGQRGMTQVGDDPLLGAAQRRALPDDERIIRDTIREETGS
ncbi:alkaline phosphatase D family protein [Alteromonas gracilis]